MLILYAMAIIEFHKMLMFEIHVEGRTECWYFLSGPSYCWL